MTSGFFGAANPEFPASTETIYRDYFSAVFSPEFYQAVLAGGSDVYANKENLLSVDFTDQDHYFTLSIIPDGWQLIILDEGKLFDGENVASIKHGNQQDMILLFHAIKSKLIINLEEARHNRLQKQAEAEDRKNNFMPEYLPGTSVPMIDWELQLIQSYATAGFSPKECLLMAKRVIWLQLKDRHSHPGSLTVFTERKPSEKSSGNTAN